jgi:hypothetical protein
MVTRRGGSGGIEVEKLLLNLTRVTRGRESVTCHVVVRSLTTSKKSSEERVDFPFFPTTTSEDEKQCQYLANALQSTSSISPASTRASCASRSSPPPAFDEGKPRKKGTVTPPASPVECLHCRRRRRLSRRWRRRRRGRRLCQEGSWRRRGG